MMDINQQKALFSIAYIESIAAQLGFNHSVPVIDDDSIDIQFSAKAFPGIFRDPEIKIQLKCTQTTIHQDGYMHFNLKKKNFNDLCGTDVIVPRYLFVINVPEDLDKWIKENDNNIQLHHLAYWYSLRDFKPITRKNKVILIPKKNIITRESFYRIMELASNGEYAV